ncbi:MAG: PDZ domain-containing protein, partial [Bacteroidota bacterium]
MHRNGKMIERKVTLKPRDDEEESVIPATDTRPRESAPRDAATPTVVKVDNLGLTVKNLDAKVRREYGVDNGVLIEAVEPGTEAAVRGLVPKDVIVSVGETPVTSAAQLKDLLSAMKTGDAALIRVKGADKVDKYIAVEIPKP